ncbi:MAG: cobalamin B12-binding domain-containing protein, partial [archaeon]|nr:cobalamin B12-binding domain-containing protein [archaeon]
MKCTLIEPPWTIAGLSESESLAEAPCYLPIELAYVAAVLREDGVEVKVIDAKSLRLRHEEVYEIVARENPDIVGVTVFYTTNKKRVRD